MKLINSIGTLGGLKTVANRAILLIGELLISKLLYMHMIIMMCLWNGLRRVKNTNNAPVINKYSAKTSRINKAASFTRDNTSNLRMVCILMRHRESSGVN